MIMKDVISILSDITKSICKDLSASPFPMRDWIKIIHTNERSASFPVEQRPDTLAISINIYSLVEKFLDLEKIVKIISHNPKLNSHLFVGATGNLIKGISNQKWPIITFLVMPVLTRYFALKKKYLYDSKLFMQIATEHISELLLDKSIVVSISPLANVQLAKECIEIDKGIRIRRLSADEIEPWLNPSLPLFGNIIPGQVLTGVRSAIEATTEITAGSNEFVQSDQRQYKNLLDALRLVTDSDIIILFTQTQSHGGPGVHGTQTVPTSIPYWRIFGPTIVITEEQSAQLIKLYHRITDSPNAERISLARTRWSITAERSTPEDKLIDCWIGLESLFTPDSSQELKFRASLRIAAFLSPAGDERHKMYSDIKVSYDWRSALIHGDSSRIDKLSKKLSLSEATSIVRGALRNAILKILDMDDIFKPYNIEKRLLN